MCPYNDTYITKDQFRTFEASQAFGASESAPWRPQVYMTLTWTHSALKPPGAKNSLDILKKSIKSWSLMKRVLNFTRNPKLAHILVNIMVVDAF